MAYKAERGMAATKKLIASCALNGVAIEGLEGAPRFRFTPADMLPRSPFDSSPPPPPRDSFIGREHCGPSGRGTLACGKAKPKHIKNWTPSRLDANPMYAQPMAGDDDELTEARADYAAGNPTPLREYLAADAAKRRAAAVPAFATFAMAA